LTYPLKKTIRIKYQKKQLIMNRKVIPIILLIFVAIGLLIYFYSSQKNSKHDRLILYGNVDVRQVDLGFRVQGRVAKMLYEEGDFVSAGSLMGVLDKNPYTDEVGQAQAMLESAQVSLQNAELLLKRRHELIGDGSISQEDLDNAITTKNVNSANFKQAKAALAVALTNFRDTEVFAPIDGYVLTRIREPGTVVKVSDPIYTLSITSPIWIRAYVDEAHLGQIYFGMPAEIHTDVAGGKIYYGKIGFISPVSEFTPKTVESTQLRTDLVYRLRIYANNPDKLLRQGMPVTIALDLSKSKQQDAPSE
jgi:HlyD family secretion protein